MNYKNLLFTFLAIIFANEIAFGQVNKNLEEGDVDNNDIVEFSDIAVGGIMPDTLFLYANDGEWSTRVKFTGIDGQLSYTGNIVITSISELTMTSSSYTTVVEFTNCRNFKFIGSGKSGEDYGIEIDLANGMTGTNGIEIKDTCYNYTIENIEIHHNAGTSEITDQYDSDYHNGSAIYFFSRDMFYLDAQLNRIKEGYTYNSSTSTYTEAEYVLDSINIKNCYIHDIGKCGIRVNQSTTTTFGDLTIYCHPFDNLSIENCKFEEIGEHSIQLFDAYSNIEIKKNYIKNTGEKSTTSSIKLDQHCNDVKIHKNWIQNSTGEAIKAIGLGHIMIYSNIITNVTDENGIYIESENPFSISDINGLYIFNNTLAYIEDIGIFLEEVTSDTNVIKNNLIIDATDDIDYDQAVTAVIDTNYYSQYFEPLKLVDTSSSSYNFKPDIFSPLVNAGGLGIPSYFHYNRDYFGYKRISCKGSIDIGACESDLMKWSYNTTTVTHKLDIPNNITSVLVTEDQASYSLDNNDYIGVFFTNEDGKLECGGYVQWSTSQGVYFDIYGQDGGTDGFEDDEELLFIIYDGGTHKENSIKAYINPADAQTFDATEESEIDSLIMSYQEIQINSGWNIISTNIEPCCNEIDFLLKSLEPELDKVIQWVDGAPDLNIYEPECETNDIGEIVNGEGYKIKLNDAKNITLIGARLPEDYSFNIECNYDLIAYLKTENDDVDQMFTSISNRVVYVKDEDGYIYYPSFNINLIGDMEIGEGYEMYINGTTDIPSFSYPLSSKSYYTPEDRLIPEYYTDYYHTYYSMGVGIMLNAWDEQPNIGDEIGIFDMEGNLCGSEVFNGNHTIILSHGDDPDTKTKEGLKKNEKFQIKVYSQITGLERTFEPTKWIQGNGVFEKNKDCITDKLEEVINNSQPDVLIYPNPANDFLNIEFYLDNEQLVDISIYDLNGRKITTPISGIFDKGNYQFPIDIGSIEEGIYFLRYNNGKNSLGRKLLIQ